MIDAEGKLSKKSDPRFKWLIGPTISLLSVIIFFVLLEFVLLSIGFGYSSQFFRSATLESGDVVIRENRSFAHPYFPEQVMRTPQPFRLNKKKGEDEYRIFVLGSSAAMGDPEASFSIARILDVMLQKAYPAKQFEVVNTAMTAINSHVVRRIAKSCAKLDPDIFVLYEGNNEVIGPYGPVGVLSPFFKSPLLLDLSIRFSESRTGQLLTKIIRSKSDSEILEKWGGMEMFLHQQIEESDPRLTTVRDRFERNVGFIANDAERAKSTLILCTVLANQRDFAPFQSIHGKELSPLDLERWNGWKEEGDIAFSSARLEEALEAYEKAESIDSDYADLAFRMGRLFLQLGDDERAQYYLKRALSQDTLRFRTDSALNNRIRELETDLNGSVTLLDLETILSDVSPNGLLGDEWLYEHVHLNFYANFQIARLLYEEVVQNMMKRGFVSLLKEQALDYSSVSERLGYTLYEQGLIATELQQRFSRAPFTNQSDQHIRNRAWSEKVGKVHAALNDVNVQKKIIEQYERALDLGGDWVVQRNFGMALLGFGEFERAVELLERARIEIDDDPDLLFSLAVARFEIGDISDARGLFLELEQLVAHYPGLRNWIDKTES